MSPLRATSTSRITGRRMSASSTGRTSRRGWRTWRSATTPSERRTDPTTGSEYVVNTATDNISEISAASPSMLVHTYATYLPPSSVAYDAARNDYYVGVSIGYTTNELLVVGATTHAIEATVDLPISPTDLLDVPSLDELWISGSSLFGSGQAAVLDLYVEPDRSPAWDGRDRAHGVRLDRRSGLPGELPGERHPDLSEHRRRHGVHPHAQFRGNVRRPDPGGGDRLGPDPRRPVHHEREREQ